MRYSKQNDLLLAKYVYRIKFYRNYTKPYYFHLKRTYFHFGFHRNDFDKFIGSVARIPKHSAKDGVVLPVKCMRSSVHWFTPSRSAVINFSHKLFIARRPIYNSARQYRELVLGSAMLIAKILFRIWTYFIWDKTNPRNRLWVPRGMIVSELGYPQPSPTLVNVIQACLIIKVV